MKKAIPRAHLEIARGSSEENVEYCSKDGDIFEKGCPPKGTGKLLTRAERNKKLLEGDLMTLVMEGDVSIHQVPQLTKARWILGLHNEPLQRHGTCGLWIYGPPGAGKTHYAISLFPDSYKKAQNKWWDGYNGQEAVLLDDLDTPMLGHYLKIWMDKWPCTGETKGGTVALRHKRFIVTSNYHPRDLWHEDLVLAQAVLRRCIIKEFK